MRKTLILSALMLLVGCAKVRYEEAKGLVFSLYPAVEGTTGNPKCVDFFGDCLYFETEQPVFRFNVSKFRAVPRDSIAAHDRLHIPFDRQQSSEFAKVTAEYAGPGKRLAIVYNGKILHAPKLREPIQTSEAIIDFCNPRLFTILTAVLRGETPPNYDFNADKACSVCVESATKDK
ncbi:MAG: hypothetical protein WC728_00845 [Elusimicrobiota bacterium]